MSSNIAKLFATFFYIGYLPFAPGTAASAACVLVYLLCYGNTAVYISVFLLITSLGFLTSGKTEELAGRKDPSCVVIDEVAGMMIALFMLPVTPSVMITAFFLFRAFDMFKIYPSDGLQALRGSAGIMVDDVIAGFYANMAMHMALKLKSLIF